MWARLNKVKTRQNNPSEKPIFSKNLLQINLVKERILHPRYWYPRNNPFLPNYRRTKQEPKAFFRKIAISGASRAALTYTLARRACHILCPCPCPCVRVSTYPYSNQRGVAMLTKEDRESRVALPVMPALPARIPISREPLHAPAIYIISLLSRSLLIRRAGCLWTRGMWKSGEF